MFEEYTYGCAGEGRTLFMEKKTASAIMLTLLFIGMLTLAFKIQPVKAVPRTWTVDDDGPADFHKIQDAINVANPGDTIFVRNGTYEENLIVNKNNLIIVGEDKVKTIIQVYEGTPVTITANRVVFRFFTVYGFGGYYPACAINMENANYCNITNNFVGSNIIRLGYSSNNVLSRNYLFSSGFFLESSSNNSMFGNYIYSENDRCINLLNSSMNTIYGNNLTGSLGSLGILTQQGSSFNIISDNNITGVGAGIQSDHCSNNIIFSNYLKTGYYTYGVAISLSHTFYSRIYCNTIIGKLVNCGIHSSHCSNNILYHNNFINNTYQVQSYNSTNVWDDGYPSGGNYWSDYNGTDLYLGPYQNETGSDGIGDTPYIIDENNTDRYPLMNPWTPLVDWIVKLISVRTIDENITYRENFGIGGDVGLEITLRSVAMIVKNVTLAIVIQDELNVPVNSSEIPYLKVTPNEKLVFLYSKLYIPKYAFVGKAKAIVSAFTESGVLYCPAVSTEFFIVPYEPLTITFHDVAVVDAVPSAETVEVGQLVDIVTVVQNEGTEIESFSVSAYYDSALIGTLQITALSSYSHATLNFTFDTSTVNPGNYAITVSIPYLTDEADLTDNIFVDGVIEIKPKIPTIIHDIAIVNVKISNNSLYIGELLQINVTIINKGTETETFNVSTYYDFSLIETLRVSALASNAQVAFVSIWNTSFISEGFYQIRASAPLPDDVDVSDNTFVDGVVQVKTKPPPPLTVSISPTSASILVGQSVTFTSTVSGGYTPYNYQWYLNGNPVSGATSNTWTFTPTAGGIYYIYLKVTDAKDNTAQSDTARITVATVPVGGYSFPIQVHTKTEPVLHYIALIAILTAIFTKLRPKTKRKR